MNINCYRFIALVGSIMALQLWAIEPNLKWGRPTHDELAMTTYDPDPEAEAVVLYSATNIRYDLVQEQFKVIKNVRKRIKVLKDEGKRWANGEINTVFVDNGYKESVTKLMATAYNLNGKDVVKTKMSGDLRNVEKVNVQQYRTKFTVPQVTVGTVIEYEYETVSDLYTYIPDWVAQEVIPVAYTQYDILVPEYIIYRMDETGMNTMNHKSSTHPLQFRLGRDNTIECQGKQDVFVGRNLPALRKCDYIYSLWAYAQRIAVEVTALQMPNAVRQNIAQTWKNIDEHLLGREDFGGRLGKNPLANEMRQEGIGDIADRNRRIAAICTLLQRRVRWNNTYAITARPAGEVLRHGAGTSADINMILVNMLNDAGLKAYPVLLRTRSHGILTVTRASMDQLNTMIVAIENDNGGYDIVDGANREGYINVLHDDLLVDRARIINKANGEKWLNLSRLTVEKTTHTVNVKLRADGSHDAMYTTKFADGAAMQCRHFLKQYSDSAALANELATHGGGKVTYMQCDGADEFSPSVTLKYHVDQSGQVIPAGGIYTPVLPASMSTPIRLTDETRTLPLELHYPINEKKTCNIWLPDGYVVEEVPEPFSMTSEDGSMKYSVTSQVNNGVLSTMSHLMISRTLFLPEEYPTIKTFMDEVAGHNDRTVLVKRNK